MHLRITIQPGSVTVEKIAGILENASGNPNVDGRKFHYRRQHAAVRPQVVHRCPTPMIARVMQKVFCGLQKVERNSCFNLSPITFSCSNQLRLQIDTSSGQ